MLSIQIFFPQTVKFVLKFFEGKRMECSTQNCHSESDLVSIQKTFEARPRQKWEIKGETNFCDEERKEQEREKKSKRDRDRESQSQSQRKILRKSQRQKERKRECM